MFTGPAAILPAVTAQFSDTCCARDSMSEITTLRSSLRRGTQNKDMRPRSRLGPLDPAGASAANVCRSSGDR
jgi:hypothetical protein